MQKSIDEKTRSNLKNPSNFQVPAPVAMLPPKCPSSLSPRPSLDVTEKDSNKYFQRSQRCSSLGRPKDRIRSLSVGRNREKDLRARYWAFLFENLYRAVDEIYQTCETDESIDESKEAILMLENYSKEFQALIQWLNISQKYENMSPPNRPMSLTWEVRKSLPCKASLKNTFLGKLASEEVKRKESECSKKQTSIAIQTETLDTTSNTIADIPREQKMDTTELNELSVQQKVEIINGESLDQTEVTTEINPENSNCQPNVDDSYVVGQNEVYPGSKDLKNGAEIDIEINASNTECSGVTFLNTDDVLQGSNATSINIPVPQVLKANSTKSAVGKTTNLKLRKSDVVPSKNANLNKSSTENKHPESLKNNVTPQIKMADKTSQIGKLKPDASQLQKQIVNVIKSPLTGSKSNDLSTGNLQKNTARNKFQKNDSRAVETPVRKPLSANVKLSNKNVRSAPLICCTKRKQLNLQPSVLQYHNSLNNLNKNGPKTHSTLSLNNGTNTKPVLVKVIRQHSDLGFVSKSRAESRVKDPEGWETVRGRTRSKNLLAKNQQAYADNIAAKQHSAIGGFSYKQGLKNQTTTLKLKNKAKCENIEDCKLLNMKTAEQKVNGVLLKATDPSIDSGKNKNYISDTNLLVECLDFENKAKEISQEENSETRNEHDTEMSANNMSTSSDSQESSMNGESRNDSKELQKSDNSEENKLSLLKVDVGSLSPNSCGDDPSSDDAKAMEYYESMMHEEAQEHVSELGLSWGEQMDFLDLESRTPGRALQMHEKLSSPFRKRSPSESIRRFEAKQLKAQEIRGKLLEGKAQRSKEIQKKVEELRVLNEKKQEQQRIILEQKLQRAEEKRKQQLEKKVKKAHDEEEKVNEIAFINTLEAQNKRHDLISKEKGHEARLLDIQEERQRKLEEKAAKEAAAEERRKVLEAERQAWLLEMQEKRKQKDLKIEQQLLEKEKERQELASQKARDREQRLTALNEAQQATLKELQKKIQFKQEESARRHEENIEQIRQKAFELSVRRYSSNNDDTPKHVPYENKKICIICNTLISSELYLLSHMRGKKHQQMIKDKHQGKDPSTEELELYNLKNIVDATMDQLNPNINFDKERQKGLKKRCKKLRQRMATRAQEYSKLLETLAESVQNKKKNKFVKVVCNFAKVTYPKDFNEGAFDHLLTDTYLLTTKFNGTDKTDFTRLGAASAVLEALNQIMMPFSNSCVPKKLLMKACAATDLFFKESFESVLWILLNNNLASSFDALTLRLDVLLNENFKHVVGKNTTLVVPQDDVTCEFMHLLSTLLEMISRRKFWPPSVLEILKNSKEIVPPNEKALQLRCSDLISYAVSMGIVDKLSQYISNIRRPINSEPKAANFLCRIMGFITSLVKLCNDGYGSVFVKKMDDSTQLLATFQVTEFVGAVSLLYCILLHDGTETMGDISPDLLPKETVLLALITLRLLNHTAVLNLQIVQNLLGSEGLSLQLRHTLTYMLWYCGHHKNEDLLYETMLLIGYLTVLHPDNQAIICAGQQPSILQQLCTLPFMFFSDPVLTEVLFPTLISGCFNNDCNRDILRQEVATELLSNYIEENSLISVSNTNKKENVVDPNIRWRLKYRFPKDQWAAAKVYFAKQCPVKN